MGREREGWVPACARTTEGEGMTGEGWVTSPSPRGQALRGNNGRGRGFHCGMTGYTGTGGSRTARTGEGAGAWGQSIFIAITGEGAHEGRPYGGRWKGRAHEGRPYGGRVERACPRGTPLRGKGGKRACPRGTPLRGEVERACTRDAPTGKGGKGVPTRGAPTGEGGKGVHEGRPYGGRWKGRARGTPLRGLGKIRKWEGRCGQGEGGMGPRMREDNGGGGDDGGGMGHIPVSTGAGSPWEQREGKGFSLWNDGLYGDWRFADCPYGRRSGCMGAIYFHSNHLRGRARRDAPTGKGG